jgi:3'-phosphoadenosine 5'-phosphosulfate sulfotransferase (PAPS reductase)/FAD synthetase
MKTYLSHGGGVDSWALYLYLLEQGKIPGKDFEAVFVNHGTDLPETYEYMDMMIAKGYPVTIIKPKVEGISSLYKYALKWKMIPSRRIRWCTQKYKVLPLLEFYQKPCVEYIAFNADEKKRIKPKRNNKAEENEVYPLVMYGINRQGCVDIIKRHGLPVPIKSGCWLCPFQRRSQWIELKQRHPDLFQKAVDLEKLCNERRKATGKKPIYFGGRPLETYIAPKDSRGRLSTENTSLFEYV